MNKMLSSVTKVFLLAWVVLVFAGAATAQDDFTYHVNPPRIPLTRSEVIPTSIPFCSNGLVICYSPQFVRAAYNFPANLDGRGQTILIVDAYGSPTIRHDLAVFG
ncbi:MAG TPA: hypothetical protein VG028_21790 [Terriglobia bacterium]|nr:hypothetical protein [Terriglobia bacterium]